MTYGLQKYIGSNTPFQWGLVRLYDSLKDAEKDKKMLDKMNPDNHYRIIETDSMEVVDE